MAMAASSIPMNDSRSHQSDPLSTVRNVWHILPSLPGVSLPVYGSMPWPPDPVGECPYKAAYHKLQMPTADGFHQLCFTSFSLAGTVISSHHRLHPPPFPQNGLQSSGKIVPS